MQTISTRKLISTTDNPVRNIPNWKPTPYTKVVLPTNKLEDIYECTSLAEIANALPYLSEYPGQFKLKYQKGQIYYIRFEFPFNTWYKVGYTAKPLMERLYGSFNKRSKMTIGGMGIPKTTKVKIIATYTPNNAYTAYQIEQAIHKLYQKERSYGLTLLKNGNSELYKRDILGLDTTYKRS